MKKFVILFSLFFIFFGIKVAKATQTDISNGGDTFIRQSDPTANFNAYPLYVGNRTCCMDRVLLKFTLPSGTETIDKLELKWRRSNGSSASIPEYSIFKLSGSFSESSATWNNQPSTIGSALATFTPTADNTWYTVNIGTAGVTWGDSLYLLVKVTNESPPSSEWTESQNREASVTNAPYLSITSSAINPPAPTSFNIASSVLFSVASTTASSSDYFLTQNGYLLFSLNNTKMILFFGFILFFITAFGFISYFAYKLTKK